jgi:hypothetical protein
VLDRPGSRLVADNWLVPPAEATGDARAEAARVEETAVAGEVATHTPLERGRESYTRRGWTDAYESLVEADQGGPLGAGDLELLATAAYMLGRDDAYVSALERAHQAYLDAGTPLRAVRCAFWLGVNFALRGEMGPATGWLGRAQRLVEREEDDCVERGYLLVAGVLRHSAAGDWDAAYAMAADAAAIGERFDESDLIALALFEQGRALIRREQAEGGLALLDEAMVGVTAGELSPIVTGLVYCAVIAACQDAYAMRRAQEWTAALTDWCEQQPDMLAFTGRCLVHRAELMQLQGSWHDALKEARRACERLAREMNQLWAAHAFYQQAEIRRGLHRGPHRVTRIARFRTLTFRRGIVASGADAARKRGQFAVEPLRRLQVAARDRRLRTGGVGGRAGGENVLSHRR